MSHRWSRTALVLGTLAGPWRLVTAQTQYYNLDAGRPTRVEDAVPAERYALEVLLASIRVERFSNGVQRWRTDPHISYGILPFTELEVRVPLVHTVFPDRITPSSTGIAGLAVGGLHAFNLETPHLPAFAIGAELLLPLGQFSGPAASYTMKTLITRSTNFARFHFVGSGGTYSIQSRPAPDTTCVPSKGCLDPLVAIPGDVPCVSAQATASQPSPANLTSLLASADPGRTGGQHWLMGIGADRAWGLQSLLVSGSLYAERFVGLYSSTDWTAEIGTRHQWTPRLVFDIGASRRFAGEVQSSAATVGLTYSFSTRALFGRSAR